MLESQFEQSWQYF